MRNTFSKTLYECAVADPSIYIVVADISPAGPMAEFQKHAPARFVNVGVAEQVMIGMCAGLALKGCQPFAYTIATFALYRPFEMVRDDLGYQNLPVTVVGMGAGVIYSTLGGTHHTMEDIAIAGAIPNFQMLAPCDPLECIEATRWCAQQKKGPVYLRIGKAGEPNLTQAPSRWCSASCVICTAATTFAFCRTASLPPKRLKWPRRLPPKVSRSRSHPAIPSSRWIVRAWSRPSSITSRSS